MSVKFWLIVTVLSVALAHTYVYTDLLRESSPGTMGKLDVSRFMTALWFSMGDALQHLRYQLKLHLEVGQRAAVQVRRGIAEFRQKRAELRARRSAESSSK
ncbi:hypothetical protein AWZ03_007959 [Drosophila navojoa]|uniref:Uncharacterized protein n=1 Tax=Drosophila navojoa TaxID=7232 RepID=A0A484BA87_DRONA|nr:hypothetical protein AWZ03_007959 [Drosophila navojoa]